MNKLLTALFAGLFAASVSAGAFAADAAKPADTAAPAAVDATAKGSQQCLPRRHIRLRSQ